MICSKQLTLEKSVGRCRQYPRKHLWDCLYNKYITKVYLRHEKGTGVETCPAAVFLFIFFSFFRHSVFQCLQSQSHESLRKLTRPSFLAVSKVANSPRSIYWASNMTPMLSGHFSVFGSVFFMVKSLLGIARQWSCNFVPKASESCQNLKYIEHGLLLLVIETIL